MAQNFLTAEWRKLLMINYEVPQDVLLPYLPPHTELDLFNGKCYVSLIGFMFMNVRVKGMSFPFHKNFEEVNLRFYVKYNDNGEWKRGVVFIKEIVPRFAITAIARLLYGEKYETRPMSHSWKIIENEIAVKYNWKKNGWHSLSATADNTPVEIEKNSIEEFISEHYWGYSKINEHATTEYGVEHPRWDLYPIKQQEVQVDFASNYGQDFSFLQSAAPASVFLAEGSPIKIKTGKRIKIGI